MPYRVTPRGNNQDSSVLTIWFKSLINAIVNPNWVDKTLNRIRGTQIVESGTITTVTTVAGLTNIDSQPGRPVAIAQSYIAWANCCRNKIT